MALQIVLRFSRKAKDQLFGRYLWITNTVSSGVLLGVGDFIQQNIERARGFHQGLPFDLERNGRIFTVGLSQGLPNHWWYTFLDRILPGTQLSTVFKKILMDQFIASPLFSCSFFLGVGVLEGHQVRYCWEEYKRKFIFVYLTDWAVWPATQFINFLYVPPIYRILYINFATVIWNIFMSYAKHYDQLTLKGDAELEKEDSLRATSAKSSQIAG